MEIAARLDLSPEAVSRIRRRVVEAGVDGLKDRPKAVARAYPARSLHVVLDHSSTHNTEEVRAWLAEHPRIQFHYTPTSASWLNPIEGFFGILAKQSLSLTHFASRHALQDHLVAYLKAWNQNATPFEWTKPARALIKSHKRMLDRLSTAVH